MMNPLQIGLNGFHRGSLFTPKSVGSYNDPTYNCMVTLAHLSKLPGNKKLFFGGGNHFMYSPKVKKLGFG